MPGLAAAAAIPGQAVRSLYAGMEPAQAAHAEVAAALGPVPAR